MVRPCIVHGCPALTERTRCAEHERGRQRDRGSPTARGYTAEYQRNRTALLREDDICWRCGRPGATTADHVVPLAHGGTSDLGNLRPAHDRCNFRAGATVRRAR